MAGALEHLLVFMLANLFAAPFGYASHGSLFPSNQKLPAPFSSISGSKKTSPKPTVWATVS